ncbi:MAG: tetratricopeptide repeat protein [Candidatus Korobacteraceae bacterium]
MLAALAMLAAAMFVFTHFVARSYEREQHRQAQLWFAQGQAALQGGEMQEAIHSLRSALAYSHDNFEYRLMLAQALVRDERLRQAESYLLGLWQQQPGNGMVNLELARIEARNGDYEQALRFYHGAVFGVFPERPERPELRRREIRLELAEYLLRVDATEQAQAELITLAADLPRDAALNVRVGDLFRQSGEHRRALGQYRLALDLESRNKEALLGAGEAAFALEQYADAARYLQRALAQEPKNTRATELMEVATLVRQMNPFLPRLSSQERARRVVAGFRQAQERVEQCASQRGEKLEAEKRVEGESQQAAASSPPSELRVENDRLAELRPRMSIAVVARTPDLMDSAMDAVARAEQTTSRLCGRGGGRDQALLLITQQREQAAQ